MQEINLPNDAPKWLKERIILLGTTGSVAYGTNLEGSDDDSRGVCIPPEEYFYGLLHFNEYNNTGGKTWKNKHGDKDYAITHIVKFVLEAMSGVPNNIEILYLRPEDIKFCNKFGKMLIDFRDNFLTKALKHKFSGYSHAQLHKMMSEPAENRRELVEQYGLDTKYAYHAVRLNLSAKQILKTGTFSAYRPEDERKLLIDIRTGKYTLEQVKKMIEDLDVEINELYNSSNAIPYAPDRDKINKWLIGVVKEALNSNWE